MKLSLILLSVIALLSACARYTEKTSPCVDQGAKPAVTRTATPALLFSAPAQNKECEFTPIGALTS